MILLEAVRVIGLSIFAFIVALGLTPIVMGFISRNHKGKQIKRGEDTPIYNAHHAHKEGTPTMAGVIIWGTVVILALLFFLLSEVFDGGFSYLNFVDRAETFLPLAAILLAGLLGLVDDLMGVARVGAHGGGIKIRHKLMLYLVLGMIGAYWFYVKLGWDVLAIPFVGDITIGWWYIPFFIFIIVASAFSTNETDGLDGLAGGVVLFGFIALTGVAFVLGRYHLAVFGGVTIGALLAFLWYNIHPARFFMGDTGSMALGVTMGVFALLTNTALLLPIFAPILVIESLSVIIQLTSKKLRGKKVFLSTPIHHHFLALGWPEAQVTMRFWIISAMGSAVGLIIFFLSRYL